MKNYVRNIVNITVNASFITVLSIRKLKSWKERKKFIVKIAGSGPRTLVIEKNFFDIKYMMIILHSIFVGRTA